MSPLLRVVRVAIITLVVAASSLPASAQAPTKDASQKVSETVEAIKSYTVERKDEAVAYARKIGADVDARIKELEAQASRQTGEAKARSQALLKDLAAKRAQAAQKAAELSKATRASWDKAKDGLAEAYREVAAAYDRAAAELKK